MLEIPADGADNSDDSLAGGGGEDGAIIAFVSLLSCISPRPCLATHNIF